METKSATSTTMSMAIAIAVAAAMLASAAVSAQQVPSCATKLIPCAQSINSTAQPPDTCCGPLKDALTNDLSCMCKIFDNPDVLKAFGIDIAAALRLPARCGMTSFTTNACSNSTARAPASPPPPPPPATPGASNRVAWMGMPGLTGLFFILLSILA